MDDIRDFEQRINTALDRISQAVTSRDGAEDTSDLVETLTSENAALKAELAALQDQQDTTELVGKIRDLEAELAAQRDEVQSLYDQLAQALAPEEDV